MLFALLRHGPSRAVVNYIRQVHENHPILSGTPLPPPLHQHQEVAAEELQ